MICNPGLLISCAIIVVFSTRIFKNLCLGIKWVLRREATELESLRWIVRRLERFVVVNQRTYISVGDTVSKGTIEHVYIVCPIKKFSGGEELLKIIRWEVLNLL